MSLPSANHSSKLTFSVETTMTSKDCECFLWFDSNHFSSLSCECGAMLTESNLILSFFSQLPTLPVSPSLPSSLPPYRLLRPRCSMMPS
jgi:hypothetical protein